MDLPLVDIVLIAALVLGAAWTVMTPTVLRSVIGLALTSVVLAVLMFQLRSPLAAVFELSVCAGLISAIFISTISLTQPDTDRDTEATEKERLRRYWYLPVILLLVGVAMLGLSLPSFEIHEIKPVLEPSVPPTDVRHLLWNWRQLDLFGQIVILLGGAFGVVALFKESKKHAR
jgi:NADH-quinone oxidoreductase subunit J